MSKVIRWNNVIAIEQETLNFPKTEWIRACDHDLVVSRYARVIEALREQRNLALYATGDASAVIAQADEMIERYLKGEGPKEMK